MPHLSSELFYQDTENNIVGLIDPNILSDDELKNLISTLFDHSKRIEAMREKAIQPHTYPKMCHKARLHGF